MYPSANINVNKELLLPCPPTGPVLADEPGARVLLCRIGTKLRLTGERRIAEQLCRSKGRETRTDRIWADYMSIKQSNYEYAAGRVGHVPRVAQRRRFDGLLGDKIAVDLYIAVELLSVVITGLVIAKVYVAGFLGATDYFGEYLYATLFVVAVYGALTKRGGLYRVPNLCRSTHALGTVTRNLLIAFAAVIALGFAARVANEYSRVWLFSWFGASLLSLLVIRLLAGSIFRGLSTSGVIKRSVAIYGEGQIATNLAREIETAHPELRLAGRFGPRSEDDETGTGEMFGDLHDLIAFGQSEKLDSIVLALPALSKDDLHQILLTLSVLPCEVQLYPSFAGDMIPLRGMTSYQRLQLLDLQRKPMSDWGVLAKRIEDVVVATCALVVFAPVLAACALAIKLDNPGPVFFRQRRHGYNNNVFTVWKFRTMSVMEDGEDVVQARRNDNRVTRVGAFLRKTSLDELPQIFNVLAGDMSVVGPRPHPLVLQSNFSGLLANYANRHRVKPGITGWAQIHGYRGPTETADVMARRVELDLHYIENWSLWLDFKIIAVTPILGLFSKNAV